MCPGRHELNVGEINYQFLFDHIDAAGYAGYVGCEYHPMSTTREGIGSLKKMVWARRRVDPQVIATS
ncbi:MAG: hypothetical protein CM1200mP41_14800 [Gammaproteobacteria bacterium]|nr:MAG: hypothetical protein CM1200mP41_14800 [Gammaproteobacteria bacterium]